MTDEAEGLTLDKLVKIHGKIKARIEALDAEIAALDE